MIDLPLPHPNKKATEVQETLTIDSHQIAQYLNKKHKALLVIIKKHETGFKAFGDLEEKATTDYRGRRRVVYALNYAQVIFLITKLSCDHFKDKCCQVFISDLQTNREMLKNLIEALQNIDLDDDISDRFVYVAMEETTGRVKIGISKHPEERIKEINVGNPDKLTLVTVFQVGKNGYRVESFLHEKYKDYHLRGEWFSADVPIFKQLPTP